MKAKYTPIQALEFVRQIERTGISYYALSKQIGVGPATIKYWVDHKYTLEGRVNELLAKEPPQENLDRVIKVIDEYQQSLQILDERAKSQIQRLDEELKKVITRLGNKVNEKGEIVGPGASELSQLSAVVHTNNDALLSILDRKNVILQSLIKLKELNQPQPDQVHNTQINVINSEDAEVAKKRREIFEKILIYTEKKAAETPALPIAASEGEFV